MHTTDKELLPENAGDIFFTDGPHPDHDISYTYIEKCDDLSYINKGISIKNFRANMGKRNLDSEFKLLRRLTENQMYTNQFRDYNPEIVKLDRYAQVVPFKHTIVRLPQITSEGSETECYINANFINSSKREESKAFIATQGPLETTRGHFWRMVWHNNVNLIIMLCKCRENNKNQSEQYWNKDKKDFEVDNYKVIMEAEEEVAKHLTRRTIRIEYNGGGEAEPQVKKVDHYQWVGWPDHETPSDEDVFVIEKFVDLIYEERTKHPDSPVVIHCSAGIGRSGTLIAIYNLEIVLRTFAESLDQVKLSVFGVVRRLREQRWGMVNTQTQYAFIYKFLADRIDAYLNNPSLAKNKLTTN